MDNQGQLFIENYVKLNKEARNIIKSLLSGAFEKAPAGLNSDAFETMKKSL